MTRAYNPKPATRALVRQIEALDGVAGVTIIAPHRGVHPTPARLLVRLDGGAQAIFAMSEAREWLRLESEAR